MGEFVAFDMRASMTGDLLWQPTLFLLAGLAGAFVASRRPPGAPHLAAGDRGCPDHTGMQRGRANQGWGLWMTGPSGEAPPTASRTTSGGPRADSASSRRSVS